MNKLESIVNLSNKVHGNKYLYAKAEFVGMLHPMLVTCSVHGDFPVTPSGHINDAQGCQKCLEEPEVALTTKDPLGALREKMAYVMSASTFDELFNKDSNSL